MDRPEARNALPELARRANCLTFDSDLWGLVFTHASFRNEFSPEERSVERLVEIIERIGQEASRLAIYEYCLDEKGMDRGQASRHFQAREPMLLALLNEFDLTRNFTVGKGLGGLDSNKNLQLGLVEKFLGLVTIASSYNNVRELLWTRIESTLMLSKGVNQKDLDPKSWLQEYCQRFCAGKQPVYELVSAVGPEHQKVFNCRVILPGKQVADASAFSLKAAQKQAASAIIDKLQLTKQMPSIEH